MSGRPYESYMKPDTEWLGELPSHWTVQRTKSVLSLRKSRVGESSSEYQLLSLTLGGIVPRDIAGGGKVPGSFDDYQVVRPRELVFCLFDIDETPRTVGLSYDYGMITSAYSIYRTLPPWHAEYAFYYFLHIDSFKGLRPFYTGLRKVVRADRFANIEVPVPPLEEQARISGFLDYETAKIDALIEKQQRLIALLEEKRQAVISHAVTKGLNPSVPMRDSGIEWLGKIPEHWKVAQLKRTWASCDYGTSTPTSGEGKYEVLTMGDIQNGRLLAPGVRFVMDVDHDLLLRSGDLLFNRTNSLALVGKVGIFLEGTNITFASYCARIRVAESCDPHFFNFLLNSSFVLASARAHSFPSISQANLNPTRYGGLHVAYPLYDEQKEIARTVKRRIKVIETTAKKLESAVDILQERRAALISAAVTGKIDVRDWTPPKTSTVEATS